MDYQQLYQRKQMTAEEAVGCVRDGDWIEFGYAACTPVALDQALAKRMPQLRDINLRGSILLWEPEIFRVPDPAEHFTWNSCHMTGIDRPLVQQGFCFHVPVRYSELPRYCREQPLPVLLAHVTPMDEHGSLQLRPQRLPPHRGHGACGGDLGRGQREHAPLIWEAAGKEFISARWTASS